METTTERMVSKAKIWEILEDKTHDTLKHYRGDLYHDAVWLHKYVGTERIVFFYGFTDSHTMIGTDGVLIEAHCNTVYEITVQPVLYDDGTVRHYEVATSWVD